jgi:hypothetical protein
MERKDYADKFRDIKNEILKEIRELVPEDSAHHFSENFYVHYIEGEVATTEICSAVEVWHGGMVVFIVHRDTTAKDEVIEGETVFGYDSDSFLEILDHLQKDIREKKLSHLRDIVKRHNGLSFDGGFNINIDERDTANNECAIVENCRLVGLRLTTDGKLGIVNLFEGETFTNEESALLDEDIDKLITYVESQIKQKFVIRVSGSFSRTFEIEANNFAEALAEAEKDWEINPLCFDDSNGEDWEDYTSVAH